MNTFRLRHIVIFIGILATVPGCYYVQATRGQIEVLSKREPIGELLANTDTPEELSRKLELMQEAREFSIDELGLPDNRSYRTYSDLERDYVVWNVFAAPEFSLQAREWCYPIVGCVAYRGYFSEQAANRAADRLRDKGFDVAVGGVPAYSTLGNFDDPVLSTMLRWDDVQLVSTLFHELAHQVLYIRNDTTFNESFASAVEEIGIERWLGAKGRKGDMTRYRERKQLHRRLVELVAAARDDLNDYYSRDIDVDTMRGLKATRLAQLADDVAAVLQATGQSSEHWLSGDLNNARLLPMTIYDSRVSAFRALYAECEFDLTCLYTEAVSISKLDENLRDARLDALQKS